VTGWKRGGLRVKAGVFGGTFDPVHIGHLAMAERVRCELKLDRVIFVPANVSPFKSDQLNSSGKHRLAMVRLAIQGNDYFAVSEAELQRGGTSYTVDTMELFSQENPEAEFFFIMGMDSIWELNGWKDVDRLAELCQLVVVTRPGYEIQSDRLCELGLSQLVWDRTCFLEVPGLEIAARDLRQRVKNNQSVRYLLTPEVEEYIRKNDLYR